MKESKCLLVAPMCTPWVTTLEASNDGINRAVSIGADDALRAVAKKIGKRTYLLYAHEGHFAGLEANRKVDDEIISGVFYVVAVDEKGQLISMTDKQLMKYAMRFYEPEHYEYSEVLANWSDRLFRRLETMAESS